MKTSWTVANGVMVLAFLLSAVVQYNDPDPFGWMAIYLAAAAVCWSELRRRTRSLYPSLVALMALVWAATIAPRVVGKVPFGSMFAEFEMKNAGVEESREMYGLLLIAVWMVAVVVAARRRRHRPVANSR